MINIWIVLGILFFHWIFDFILQTDEEAKGKSTSIIYLLNHTATYSMLWIIPAIIQHIYYNYYSILFFPFITFFFHTITDYFTSKLNKKLWESGNSHKFFVSVGFDQWLHAVQLLLTYYYLSIWQ